MLGATGQLGFASELSSLKERSFSWALPPILIIVSHAYAIVKPFRDRTTNITT
jgi:hypothetical protein